MKQKWCASWYLCWKSSTVLVVMLHDVMTCYMTLWLWCLFCIVLQSFTLLDKKSIVAKGIRSVVLMYVWECWLGCIQTYLMNRDFSWSPTDNLVAYWVPGRDSIPAKIIIIELPSRKEICTKSRHEVKEVCIHIVSWCVVRGGGGVVPCCTLQLGAIPYSW